MNTHTNTDYLERDVKQSEPAKVWRNRYWLPMRCRNADGDYWGPGIIEIPVDYPSKQVAESVALKSMRLNQNSEAVSLGVIYAGAFPLDGDGK